MKDRVIIIPASAVSHLKKKAKRRQRETGRPHHEMLEEVAIAAGFQNWHQVTQAESETKALEKQLRKSLVVLMDVKEASDLGSEFERATEVLALRDHVLIEWLRQQPEDDGPDESDAELREFLHDNYVCMRYVGTQPLPSPSTVVEWFREYSFWQPSLIWLRGQLIDPDAPDDDEDLELDEDDAGPDEPMPEVPEATLRAAFGQSTARSKLILASPDTMERYKGIEGPRKAWNWCLHCERAYPQGSYRQQGDLQMCPYAKCEGDAFMDLWTWSRIRKENPTYPETPELGVRYGLYGDS